MKFFKAKIQQHLLHYCLLSQSVLRNRLIPVNCYLITLVFFIGLIPSTISSQTQTIRVGLPSVPPVIYRDEDGSPQGFHIIILAEIAKEEGWNLEYIDGSWKECYNQFLEGEIDILPGLSQTPEREKKFDFLEIPFYHKWTTLFIHPSEEFHTVAQMKDKRIGMMEKDQNAESFIRFLSQFNFNWTPIWFSTHQRAFDSLHQKKIYGVVCYVDEKSNYESYWNAKSTGLAIDPLPSSIGFPKGKNVDIRQTINQYLEKYKADPSSTFNQLSKKPMHFFPDNHRIPEWIWWSYLLFILTLLTLIIISILTRRAISKEKKALRASKTTYQTMVDNLTVAVAIFQLSIDEEGNLIDAVYLSANPRYFKITRLGKQSMEGVSFRQIHGEERFCAWASIMEHVYIKGEPVEFELQDKQTKHWFAGRAVRFEKKKIAVLCHDITKEKREVNHLEQSEQKFRQFFEKMNDGVLILNYSQKANSFNILDSNPSLHKMFNLSKKPDTLNSFLELIDTSPEEFKSNIFDLNSHTEKSNLQFKIEIKAQSYRVHCLPIHDQIIGLIFINITEEQAKELLHSKISQTSIPFLNFSHECLVYINNELKIDWANYQALQYCSLKLSQIKGHSFEKIFGERRILKEDCPVQESFNTKNTITRDDFTLSNGHILSISVIPQMEVNGKLDHLLMAFVDITELRMREEQQLQLQKMEILGHLSGGIAHDFNNILQAVLGFSDILKDKFKDNPNISKNIQAISDAGNHGAKLVKQLMGFTRKERSEPALINLNEQLKDLMKMLKRIIGDSVSLELIPSNQNLLFHADPNQLDQSVINLCINARDAITHHNGTITLKTGTVRKEFGNKNRRTVFLSITDNGMGIPEDQRQKIFDPFYTTKEKGKGTGLGLASVKEIVNHHNGIIELESKIGVGTTFTLFFPTQDESSSLEVTPKRTAPKTPVPISAKYTILLAEDNEKAAIFTRTILEEMGYKVFMTNNGREALSVYNQHEKEIDLLFFDLIMPEMTGRQAYDEIRKSSPHIPIIFCSGYDQNELPQEYIDKVGACFLPKPFRAQDLKHAIHQITLKIKKGSTE